MLIGGLDKFSLIDYPEHLAAIIFTQGCNFRCHFCYNPVLVVSHDKLQDNASHELVRENGHSQISEDDLFIFLKSRIGKLDGVVISGGEPTLHRDLPELISKIKTLGFDIKLDTNGTNPKMLQKLIDNQLIDYIAMDIKGPENSYENVVSAKVDLKKIQESIKIIIKSSTPYEFRTTMVPGLHTKSDIAMMGAMIKGAAKWYLQEFKANTPLVDKKYEGQKSFDHHDFEEMQKMATKYVDLCETR
jgi:pyruvate formate lyase activating enzyme